MALLKRMGDKLSVQAHNIFFISISYQHNYPWLKDKGNVGEPNAEVTINFCFSL